MVNIKGRLLEFKDRLTRMGGNEPLSKLSLSVILIIDLFILSVIFQGLNDHTQQLTSPDEYVPSQCREVFIQNEWSDTVFLARLQGLVLSEYNNTSYRYDGRLKSAQPDIMHPSCRALFEKLNQIARDQNLKNRFVDRQVLLKEKTQVTQNLNNSKEVYDTSLLENIAAGNKNTSNQPALKDTIAAHTRRIETITRQLIEIERQINADDLILSLKAMIQRDQQYRENLVEDYKRFQFSYPLKELGWQLIFMLPLFIIFYAWSSRSARTDSQIQTLISTHLLVVAFIPIVFKITEVVLDLIPRHFFKDLFKLLKALHIIALWHYIVIFAAICAGVLTVYIIQKKIFNIKRIQQKRLAKGECYSCGTKLPNSDGICPFCGANQFRTCEHCQAETYISGDFCRHCGHRPGAPGQV